MLKNYLTKLFAVVLLVMAWGGAQSQTTITITEPASIAGDYAAQHAAFGPYLGGQSAPLVLIDDGAGATTGCAPASNDLTGAVALIDRGVCGFAIKVAYAELAGAIAVIVCNNDMVDPDALLIMGNAAGDPLACEVGIPAAMVSFNTCQAIKAELAGGVSAAMPDEEPLPGEDVTTAIPLPGAGTYTATDLTGTGATNIGLTDAVAAQVYSIVAPSDAVMTVSSCLGGTDTRLWVLSGCRNGPLVVVGQNDDACELEPGGDEYASSVDVIVSEGVEYLIFWDDRWEPFGFDFTVSFGVLPSVNVTFNVDMNNETVDPSGVKIAGSFNGWTQEDMTDNGNGTYSFTATVTAGDELFWKYLNGTDGWEPSADLATCGVDDGVGGFNRAGSVGLDDASAPLVCFASCFPCPPPACSNPAAIICDNFDDYALGSGTGANAAHWTTWSGTVGGAEDGLVTDQQAASAPHSMLIAEGQTQDVLLLLGNRTTGNYRLSWKTYIPANARGYFNIQESETPGVQWNGEFYYNQAGAAPGTGTIVPGNVNFTYPEDAWFDVVLVIDLDNDQAALFIDGTEAYSWAYVANLGSINFFSVDAANRYYIDDVEFLELPSCDNPDAIICDGIEFYAPGSTTGANADHWTTWSGTTGGTEDGIVSTAFAANGANSMLIAEGQIQDVLLLLGNRTSGGYAISWNMYVPTGKTGYYNIQNSETPGLQWNLNVGFGITATGATSVFGQGLVFETGTAFTYPQGQWFEVAHIVDLDNNVAELWIDGVQIEGALAYPGNLGAINFFSINADNRYYIDDVLFAALPVLPGEVCNEAIDVNDYLGGGLGVTLTTPPVDNTDYTTSAADPAFGWECFGEPDGGGAMPSLERTVWFTFVGDGNTYLIEARGCGDNPITSDDTQMAIYSGDCGSLVSEACNDDFDFSSNLFFASLEFETQAGVTYQVMVDGFGPIFEAIGEFCLNFTQLTEAVPTVAVTFQVDLTPYLEAGNALETVRIAGNFGDNGAIGVPNWDPPSAPAFTHLGDDVYSATIEFPASSAGQDLEFKFLNTATSWGECGLQQECMPGDAGDCKNPVNDNRLLVLPSAAQTICFTWETCLGCNVVNVREQIQVPMTIAPNPFSNRTVVNFHTPILDGQVRLTALTGQLVRTYRVNGPQLIIEKDGMVSGVYFLNVVTENGTSVAEKLIVE